MSEIQTDLEIESVSNSWVDSGRTVTVLGVHAFVVVPFLILLFYPRWWVLFVCISNGILLKILDIKGYSPIFAFRAVRSKLAGKVVKRNRRIGSHRIWR